MDSNALNRRNFLKGALAAAAGGVGAAVLGNSEKAEAAVATKFAVLVDVRNCINCKACQIACKMWNDNNPDPTTYKTDFTPETWTYVKEVETGYYPSVIFSTAKRQCMHCNTPLCVAYCPQKGKAIHKEPDGPVLINDENCVRCRACVHACPYGVPKFDATGNKIQKCIFCFDRIRAGLAPACVDTCIASVFTFGDLASIRQTAEGARIQGFPVLGLDENACWIYIFQKGVDPRSLIPNSF